MSALGVPGQNGGSEGSGPTSRSSLVVQMGARIGRDSAFYTFATSMVFPIGLLNVIMLTHFLRTSQYGQLGVLFFMSGFVTVILNMLFLRGIERNVWGSTDEAVDINLSEMVAANERPRVLGTGLMMTNIACLLTILGTVPFAPQLSQLLLHNRHHADAVIWMAVSGALGSVWRVVANTSRWERRPGGFGLVYVLRPALAIPLAYIAIRTGYGIAGVMAATAIATLLSTLVGLGVSWNSFRFTLERRAAKKIARASTYYAAMVGGLYVLHNGDVYFLSLYGTASATGVYRLATNVTSIVSYVFSAFLLAWGPLEASSLFMAAYEGPNWARLRAEFVHYYLTAGVWLVLILSAAQKPLVAVFASSYQSAFGFIPITALGYLAYSLILIVARSSIFPRRYFVYGVAGIASGAALGITSAFLAPPLGGYGVAIGDVVGGLTAVGVILFAATFWGRRPACSVYRLGGLFAVGGACYAIGGPLADASGGFEPWLKLLSALLFVPLALLTGVIPARHRHTLWAIVRATLRVRARPGALLGRVAALPRTDRYVLEAFARDGESTERASLITGLPEPTVRLRLVAALRRLADAGAPSDTDAAIATYLLDLHSVTERDGIARSIWESGQKPVELFGIETTFKALRKAPAKAWEQAGESRRPPSLPEHEWPVDETALAVLDGVVREGRPLDDVAPRLGLEPRDAQRRVVGALRALSGEDGSHPADALIGAFLLNGSAQPEARHLWAAGVDPIELHRLELVLAQVRALPRRRWRRVSSERPQLSAPSDA